jgi:hypothetical protein
MKIIDIKRISMLALSSCIILSGCATPPPNDPHNLCDIFRQYPKWYWDTSSVRKRWGTPISVQMAIVYQESSFDAHAQPPREKLLGIIPWKRPTTAYGYSQALKGTWEHYEASTGNNSYRGVFGDAVDFIGWYSDLAYRKAGIPKSDAYHLYLAYHEGISNYLDGTYRKKPAIMNAAHQVQRRARNYKAQLNYCESSLPTQPWYWKFF